MVWTTIAQTHGVEQGVHFNASNDLEPLIDSPAAAEAFRVMAALLAAAAPPEPDEACTHGALGFARGKCALVVAGMVPQLKVRSGHRGGVRRGRHGRHCAWGGGVTMQ